ncbi:phosphopantetheine-binding protein [Micromonospora peucetia]|uniref:Phosphopantetheine attachment site n=1 Tax=Micromonospora peucetia TaxID=47871 RepID=A0A1C6W036_9ACTN|nr:phosphopantetheine-binding protein [Micromonospora peucetia]MCX4390811.1 phosphopantetheine-binding protein [Micromonospora peucetia]WSA31750.1 phosphopantetheine-binding protein [Micromonospora peucetia]SCL71906.1 Phosphopantetheine attachment site [Micromonospora peucetia]
MRDVDDRTWVGEFEQLWMEVLGVDTVDDDDDFFDLGGHSLSALRLSTLIRQELNLAVMFGHVLENPRFADLRDVAGQVPLDRDVAGQVPLAEPVAETV